MKTVIYLDQDLLKIVVAKSRLQQPFPLLVIRSIKGLTDSDIASEIKKNLKKVKGSTTDVALGLPRNLVTLKNLVLPSTQPEEIKSMMEFQVTKWVPHPRSEIVYDYYGLGPLPNQCSLIRVAVLHRKVIEHALSILSEAGVQPTHIRVGSENVGIFLSHEKDSTAAIDVDYHQTHVIFFQKGQVHFSRSIPIGFREIHSRNLNMATGLSDFLSEVEASIALFPVEQDREKIPVFLMGASSVLHELVIPLHERLKREIQTSETSFQAVSPVLDYPVTDVSWVNLISLLEPYAQNQEFNLLPPDVESLFQRKSYYVELKRLLFFLGAVLLTGCWAFLNEVKLEKNFLGDLKAKIASIEKDASTLDLLRSKVLALKDHIEHRGDCLRIISSLLETLTEGVYLKTVGYDTDKVSLRGYAPTLAKIFELTGLLQKNPLFTKIQTHYARQTLVEGQAVAEFHLECTLAAFTGEENVRKS
ncbi:MAG: pilus assembly protein PilM [Chlamydiae bacterium]|nr:pilus assembly protein PilM [Chlamydiota bacterium]MBI3267186.1 pilus assembly protein PilM [Chlamydiota bacterium]